MATREKRFSFGCVRIDKVRPQQPPSSSCYPPIVNLFLTMEEAMKLVLAVDENVRHINRLNRSLKEGKAARVNLAIHLNQNPLRITVNRTGRWERKVD